MVRALIFQAEGRWAAMLAVQRGTLHENCPVHTLPMLVLQGD